jgi:hypothetical protein
LTERSSERTRLSTPASEGEHSCSRHDDRGVSIAMARRDRTRASNQSPRGVGRDDRDRGKALVGTAADGQVLLPRSIRLFSSKLAMNAIAGFAVECGWTRRVATQTSPSVARGRLLVQRQNGSELAVRLSLSLQTGRPWVLRESCRSTATSNGWRLSMSIRMVDGAGRALAGRSRVSRDRLGVLARAAFES